MFDWIRESEEWVDQASVNLYAGINQQSPAVRRAMSSTLNARPSLGPPGDKYETGLAFSDQIETWVEQELCALFEAHRVEYRVFSGSMANLYAYMATTKPGDAIYAMPENMAGHATHLQQGAAGLYGLKVHAIPCHPATHNIDWETWNDQIGVVQPKLIILGTSLPLVPVEIERARDLARTVNAYLMYDAAHVAMLVAQGRFQRPLAQGADLMTMSTYKSFGGPAGGIIATNREDLAQRLDGIAYPGLTANFDMARVAGLGVAALELRTFGQEYADQCLKNAEHLTDQLLSRSLPVWLPDGKNDTKSHILALKAERYGGGTTASRQAEISNVLFSGIPLPLASSVTDYNGLRLGVQELTRIGMRENHMAQIAEFIHCALHQPDQGHITRNDVKAFRKPFQKIHYGFSV